MCFSAGASFAAGSLLIPAGVFCIRRGMARSRDHLCLAVTPIIFGVQQICEGFVWRGLQQGDAALVRNAALAFLFFALFFWPVWTPITAIFFDGRLHPIKLSLLVAVALSASVACALVYVPLLLDPERLHVDVSLHSIRYQFESTLAVRGLPRAFWQLAYVAIVTFPFLLSRRRPLRIFGLFISLASIAAQFAYWYAFVSVWCAFAALLSASLCWLFQQLPEDAAPRIVPQVSGTSG